MHLCTKKEGIRWATYLDLCTHGAYRDRPRTDDRSGDRGETLSDSLLSRAVTT